jgi:hypothetical protein
MQTVIMQSVTLKCVVQSGFYAIILSVIGMTFLRWVA